MDIHIGKIIDSNNFDSVKLKSNQSMILRIWIQIFLLGP